MNDVHHPARPTAAKILLIAFLALTCWKAWFGPSTMLPIASAQIPDSGLQRKLILDELKKTNALLTDLNKFLHEHTFKVRLEGTDKTPAASRGQGTP